MDWIFALNQMKKSRGFTTDDIVERSGISKGTLNKLLAGQTKDPQLNTVRQLVHSMGYTLDDLDKDTLPVTQPPHYSDLLPKYRAIVDSASIEAFSQQVLEEQAATSQPDILPDNVIVLRKSCQAASMGHGVYLGPEAFEEIRVKKNGLTGRATFAVPVEGDSMEPKYHDGDVLLIDSNADVDVGEIGLFTLDGNGYVKKRGFVDLISLNPDYDPIPLDDTIRCNGRVIGTLNPDWIIG